MRDRDAAIMSKIVQYAEEICGTITRFDLDLEKFSSDYVAKNAIAMCILQVGELVGKLTDEFKATHAGMPWRDIVSMRNRTAHAYSSMDVEFIWKTAVLRIPELRAYCESIVRDFDEISSCEKSPPA